MRPVLTQDPQTYRDLVDVRGRFAINTIHAPRFMVASSPGESPFPTIGKTVNLTITVGQPYPWNLLATSSVARIRPCWRCYMCQ